MFEQITKENLLQAIAYTSGIAGVSQYETTVGINNLHTFLKWYNEDTSYCTKEAKEVAEKVMNFLCPTGVCYNVLLMSCDELIEFMIEHYDEPYRGDDICFQGDIIEVDGFCVNITLESELILDVKHPGYAFIISPWKDNKIQLSIFRGSGNMDQRPAAIIPDYVKQELIATIEGKW